MFISILCFLLFFLGETQNSRQSYIQSVREKEREGEGKEREREITGRGGGGERERERERWGREGERVRQGRGVERETETETETERERVGGRERERKSGWERERGERRERERNKRARREHLIPGNLSSSFLVLQWVLRSSPYVRFLFRNPLSSIQAKLLVALCRSRPLLPVFFASGRLSVSAHTYTRRATLVHT